MDSMDSKLLISIIDFLPDATFVINNEKKVIAWNRAIENMTGVGREDILGKGDYMYAVPFYGEKRYMLIDLVMDENGKTEARYEYIKKSGHTIYAEALVPALNNGKGAYLWGTASPLFDDKGKCQGVIESIRDVTVRKMMEIKLKDSEEKLRTIFDQTFQLMGLLNVEGIMLAANKAALDFIGATEADVVGKPFCETPWWSHSKEEQDKLKKAIKTAASGKLVRFKTTHMDKNGTPRYIDSSLRPVKNREGDIIYLNAEGRDITDVHNAEKALRESEERWHFALEGSGDGVWDWNVQTNEVFFSKKWKEMLGFKEDEIEDNLDEWSKRVHPDDMAQVTVEIQRHFKKESPVYVSEHRVQCKDGAYKWILDRGKVMSWTEEGTPLRMVGTHTDITERKTTEKTLKDREEELAAKSTKLEEVNAALRVLLKERENDKVELEEKILSNVKELIFPYIEKLKKSRLDSSHMAYVNIIDTNLNDIVSPFLKKMALKFAHLTPTEIQIANLIKSGNSTKEIGVMLHMSSGAINFHRNNIRKKLGLNKSKINLISYLATLQ